MSISLPVLILILLNIYVSFKGFKDIIFFEKFHFNINSIKNGEYYRFISSGFLAVAAADDEYRGWVGVGKEGQVCDHLLVRVLVAFGELYDAVEHEDGSVGCGLEDDDVLEV